ncbi:MAG: hypothetical protein Q8R16_03590 [bacterium]|nr:hypothetical protein [bacterium]
MAIGTHLNRIRSELDSISFFLLIAAISTCGMCNNLDDIDNELEQTNVELRETRKVLERVLEQQRAR